MKTWNADLPSDAQGLFFGAINVSRTILESADNRLLCMEKMESKPLITPYQWHSADCVIIDEVAGVVPEGDALVTTNPDIVIGVVTADCAPVLFRGVTAEGNPVVGAAHAGARGALKGILAATIRDMRTLGAVDIQAAIGPCIHQASYEVGVDFQAEFTATDPGTAPYFRLQGDKFLFDLPGYVGALLERDGVAYTLVDVDTYAEETDCFSYRRATHRGEADYGRQLSAITISAV